MWDLWTQGTDSIHDMRVVNTYAVSYQSKTPEKCLETTECKKKRNYLNACLNEHIHFTPSINLVDDLLEVKAEATLKRITSRLAQKWKELYSRTCGYRKSKVAITLVQATHSCIQEGRGTAPHISVTLSPVGRRSGRPHLLVRRGARSVIYLRIVHTCREYRRRILPVQNPKEMPGDH